MKLAPPAGIEPAHSRSQGGRSHPGQLPLLYQLSYGSRNRSTNKAATGNGETLLRLYFDCTRRICLCSDACIVTPKKHIKQYHLLSKNIKVYQTFRKSIKKTTLFEMYFAFLRGTLQKAAHFRNERLLFLHLLLHFFCFSPLRGIPSSSSYSHTRR